jgi:23S rRNA (adenine-N6)-dimethyltransferase
VSWNLPRTPYKVFANIPFNKTTNIVRKLTGSSNPPEEAWLVIEKGVAKRFMGTPNETIFSLNIKPSGLLDYISHEYALKAIFFTEAKRGFYREAFHEALR